MQQRALNSIDTLADEIMLYFSRWNGIYVKMNHHDPAKFVKSINRMKGNDYQIVAARNGNYLGYISKDTRLEVDGRDYDMYIFLPKDRAEVIAKLIKTGVYAN